MLNAAVAVQAPPSPPFPRVAIIDDVFAGPKILNVKEGLGEFCAAVKADDELSAKLKTLTGCDCSESANITEAAITALFKHKAEFPAAQELFLDFDQKLQEVERIQGYLRARGHDVTSFSSVTGLFDGEPFQLVLLDLLLAKGKVESEDIAKQIYAKFKSFIILMSNSPGASAEEEDFRRRSRLLRGFFQFYAKEDLDDAAKLNTRLEAMPKNHDVCHAVHAFVDSIDHALGGRIEEPPTDAPLTGDTPAGRPVGQFMHTLRTLGLQDYAILCELTLRDEGHPLGDYMMRLLGFHLIARLLADEKVRASVGKLDKMRFTEFLPYGEETSASFKMLYADSLTERVVEPWSSHPWQATPASSQNTPEAAAAVSQAAQAAEEPESPAVVVEAGGPEEESAAPSKLVPALGMTDDGADLPFLQLGDLLIRDEASLVYAVLTASCDLQFTPENVSKARPRERDDTVLLLPGSLRRIGEAAKSKPKVTTGLLQWQNVWYSVDWSEGKVVGLPHCVVRRLFEASNYKHERRLQMGRALELQQNVISHISRIGLEVQPPLPMDLSLSVYAKKLDNTFVMLGTSIVKGALVFHLREKAQPVLVLRQTAFHELRIRMQNHAAGLTSQGTQARGIVEKMHAVIKNFFDKMIGLKVPILMPESPAPGGLKHVDTANPKKSLPVTWLWIQLGGGGQVPAITNKDVVYCLSVEVA